MSAWCLDLIGIVCGPYGKVSGQNERIKIGFFTVPQKTKSLLGMSGECLEIAS